MRPASDPLHNAREAIWAIRVNSNVFPGQPVPLPSGRRARNLKKKDLIGVPWLVAFALRDAGWYLRNEVVWAKGSPVPQSADDRLVMSHEHVFLFSQSEKYYFDLLALKEELSPKARGKSREAKTTGSASRPDWTVWHVNPQPTRDAHTAPYPPRLVEPMVLAGSSAFGACPRCGAPWERQTERPKVPRRQKPRPNQRDGGLRNEQGYNRTGMNHHQYAKWLSDNPTVTVGWTPTCACKDNDGSAGRCVILDPFSGSGTTGAVALRLGRSYVGVDLNAEYLPVAERKIGL